MKQIHVRLFNLENHVSLKEYEDLLTKCVNSPTKYKILKEPEKIIKTFTSGDIDSKSTYQEVWLLVEYMEDTQKTEKKNDTEIFE